MKNALIFLAVGMLAGCDYCVPLVSAPTQPIEAGLLGVWQQQKEGGSPATLLVLPLGGTEYLVSFPAGAPDAMFARACLGRVGDRAILQLQWLGTAKGATPENDRVYQYAAYTIAGDTLTARLVNADRVDRDAKSADELRRAITATTDEADLFREPMVFKKVIQGAGHEPGGAAAAAAATGRNSQDYLKNLGRDGGR